GAQSGTASFSTSVSSLTCNTTYYVRSYATNLGGTGYGSIQSFTTSACTASTPPSVTTGSATSVTSSSATENGTITSSGSSSVTDAGFAYSTDSSLSSVIATSSVGAASGPFSHSLSSLYCNTIYYVRAYATNGAGTAYGAIQAFTASACAAPASTSFRPGGSSGSSRAAVSTVSASTPSASSASVSISSQTIASLIQAFIDSGLIPETKAQEALSAISVLSTTASHPAVPRTNLSSGNIGPAVHSLQSLLNSKGYTISSQGPGSPGHETDVFGSLTKAALVRFQKDNGIPPTGYFGPLTRAALGE
ncbi:MAG: peptidoglycan-binding protein, partial [Patescibacteria group bacterium]|nr:peptidoglycan-binding protein [Patescibacteria group bacterium]